MHKKSVFSRSSTNLDETEEFTPPPPPPPPLVGMKTLLRRSKTRPASSNRDDLGKLSMQKPFPSSHSRQSQNSKRDTQQALLFDEETDEKTSTANSQPEDVVEQDEPLRYRRQVSAKTIENESFSEFPTSMYAEKSPGKATVGKLSAEEKSSSMNFSFSGAQKIVRKTRMQGAFIQSAIKSTLTRSKKSSSFVEPERIIYTRRDWLDEEEHKCETEYMKHSLTFPSNDGKMENISRYEICKLFIINQLKSLNRIDVTQQLLFLDLHQLRKLLASVNMGASEEIVVSFQMFKFLVNYCYKQTVDFTNLEQNRTLRMLYSLIDVNENHEAKLKDLTTILTFFWCNSDGFFPKVNTTKLVRLKNTYDPNQSSGLLNASNNTLRKLTAAKSSRRKSGSFRKFQGLMVSRKINKPKANKKKIIDLRRAQNNALVVQKGPSPKLIKLCFSLFDYGHEDGLSKQSFQKLVHTLSDESLDIFLNWVPFGEEAFSKFLQQTYCGELMLFYRWMREQQAKAEKFDDFDFFVSTVEVSEIADKYIKTSAQQQINISAKSREKALTTLSKNEKQKRGLINLSFLQPVFDEAFELMESDSFPRFRSRLLETKEHGFIFSEMVWKELGLEEYDLMSSNTFSVWAKNTGPLFNSLSRVKSFCVKLLS